MPQDGLESTPELTSCDVKLRRIRVPRNYSFSGATGASITVTLCSIRYSMAFHGYVKLSSALAVCVSSLTAQTNFGVGPASHVHVY
jgi:hypothetical protein